MRSGRRTDLAAARVFFVELGLKLQGEGVEAAGWNYLPRRTPWRVAQTLGAVLFVAAIGESRGSVRPRTIRSGYPAWLTSVQKGAGPSTVR